mgnify:FL=1
MTQTCKNIFHSDWITMASEFGNSFFLKVFTFQHRRSRDLGQEVEEQSWTSEEWQQLYFHVIQQSLWHRVCRRGLGTKRKVNILLADMFHFLSSIFSSIFPFSPTTYKSINNITPNTLVQLSPSPVLKVFHTNEPRINLVWRKANMTSNHSPGPVSQFSPQGSQVESLTLMWRVVLLQWFITWA